MSSDRQTVLFRVERADLRTWLDVTMPVIFVVYDASAEVAYWLYVQQHFVKQPRFDATRGSQTVTLRIPAAQRLDGAAVRVFARFRDKIRRQQSGVGHNE